MRRIVFIQYTNPAAYPPLQRACSILAGRSWNVCFFGTGALGTDALQMDAHPRVTVRLMRHAKPGWRQKLHYLEFAAKVARAAVRHRPDWIYASDPLSCLPAILAAKITGARMVYHEHDCPDAAIRSLFWSAVKQARRHAARQATLCVLPNSERARWFAKDVQVSDSRVMSVWNCPTKEECQPDARAHDESRFWIYFHGSVNSERLPLAVVESLALLPKRVGLRVVGYETIGSRGYFARLAGCAAALGLELNRLEIIGLLKRQDMLTMAQSCHVGLALMPLRSTDINMNAMVGASNKAFEYLACGLPVLVSDLPEWTRTFVAPGYALACNPADAASIAERVKWLLDNPDKRRCMGNRGRERILDDWNYETQFAPVLSALERDS